MRLYGLLIALFLVASCEQPPLAPSPVDEDNDITIINIINNDDHSGDGRDDGDDGDGDPTPNSGPFINPVGTQTNDVGDNVALAVTAVDADGDNLTWQWEANSAPRNLTLQSTGPNTALISGVISSASPNDSPFTVRLFVSDGKVEAQTVFTWVVNAPPS